MKILGNIKVKLFLTFFIIFFYFAQWNDLWDFNSSLALTRAVVEKQMLEIDFYHNTTEVKSYYNGHYYTPISPGISFLFTWIYLLGWNLNLSISVLEFFAIISTNIVFSTLSVVIIYKILDFFTRNENHKLIATFTYGLATSVFPYSLGFYPYIPSLSFVLLTFYLILKEEKGVKKCYKNKLLMGVFLGFACITYFVNFLILPLLLIYITLVDRKTSMLSLVGIMMGTLPLLLYNYGIYGYLEYSPLRLFYYHTGMKLMWNPPPVNPLKILPRVLFFPWNGLFFYYPILFISLCGIFLLCKEGDTKGWISFLIFITITSWSILFPLWWGGFSFGPRRFLLSTPFLLFGLPTILKRNTKFVYPFIIFSVFVNLLGLQRWTTLEAELSGNITETYLKKIESFQPFTNVLMKKYLPRFIQNGPRSPLFENLVLERKIDVRLQERENLEDYELELFKLSNIRFTLKLPFLCLIPFIIVILFIWWREIFTLKIRKFF
ncbi:MAG: hypothetical protein QXT38_01370 [Candidatus Aenigmatarchaeota archaeon]